MSKVKYTVTVNRVVSQTMQIEVEIELDNPTTWMNDYATLDKIHEATVAKAKELDWSEVEKYVHHDTDGYALVE